MTKVGAPGRAARKSAPSAWLARLAYLYDRGRYAESIALGESILQRRSSDNLRAKIRLQLALAYIQLGWIDLAEPLLAQACRHFEAVNDAEMLAECAGAKASMACVQQSPDALQLALTALDACRSLSRAPNALQLRILNGVASAQWLVGLRKEALRTLEEAIQLADPVLDMRRLAKLLDCAGIAYAELGQMDKAVEYSSRALALFETLNDEVSLARTANNVGWTLIGNGQLRAARKYLERSLKLFEESEIWHARSTVLCSLCELCLAEGDIEQAMAHADAAIAIAEDQQEAWSIAEARVLRGRIAGMRSDDAAADRQFQAALTVMESSGMPERLVVCHAAYAEALEDRGDLTRAYEHVKAAVRITGARVPA